MSQEHVQTLTVEGPALFMERPYYQYTEGSTSVDIGICLQGNNTLPVIANLTVQQRILHGSDTLEGGSTNLDFWLDQSTIQWEAGKPGMQTVKLHVSGNMTSLASGGLLVEIMAAENADIEAQNSTSVLTALGNDSLIVGFALQPNQASYCCKGWTSPPGDRPAAEPPISLHHLIHKHSSDKSGQRCSCSKNALRFCQGASLSSKQDLCTKDSVDLHLKSSSG